MLWAERLRARATRALYDAERRRRTSCRAKMDHVHHELAEVQERLDFAERMLTQRHEQDRVPQKGP